MSTALMDISEWIADPSLASQWKRTWAQPHMLLGLQVLISNALKPKPVVLPGSDLLQTGALLNAKREGYHELLASITTLGEIAVPPASSSAGWGESKLIDPENSATKRQAKTRK